MYDLGCFVQPLYRSDIQPKAVVFLRVNLSFVHCLAQEGGEFGRLVRQCIAEEFGTVNTYAAESQGFAC